MHEVLADAGARVDEVLCRRPHVGRALAVGEAVRDQVAERPDRRRRRVAAGRRDELLEHAGGAAVLVDADRLVRPVEQELATGRAVGGRAERLPGRARDGGRRRGDDPGADVDREVVVRGRDAELDDLGAEVVEVALQPRLGVDADVEVVDALRGRGGRPHAQGVEVVGHRMVVAVLREVADAEVHAADHQPGAARRSSARRCRWRPSRAPPGRPGACRGDRRPQPARGRGTRGRR